MQQFGIVGLSHRHAGAQELSRLFIPREDLPARLPELRAAFGVAEIAYLGTCNRVEIVFCAPEGVAAEDLRRHVVEAFGGAERLGSELPRHFRTWTGEAALEHLFLVACGLDSAQVGEREIAAQLRIAWETAREAGTSGPMLDRALGEALAMMRRAENMDVRTSAPSIADLGTERVLAHLDALGVAAPVALIGVSPMTRRCGAVLHARGVPLIIVNRSEAPADELARELRATALTLDSFRLGPPRLAAALIATGSAEPVLDRAALARVASAGTGLRQLIVDFSTPNNVDPDDAAAAGLERIGMDELVAMTRRHRTAYLVRLAPIRAAIDERLSRLRSEFATRSIGTRLGNLRHTSEQVVASEVEKLLSGELRNLEPASKDAIRRWGAVLAHRLAHLQLSGVRAAAEHASPEALDAFFEGASLSRMR